MVEDTSTVQPIDDTQFEIVNDIEVVSVYENETTVQQLLIQALEILNKAFLWADAAEGVEVEPGKYSSFHFSEKTREIYEQFIKDKQFLQQNSDEFDIIVDFVKRLINELPDVPVESGVYSAKHYLTKTQAVSDRIYLQFNDMQVLYDNLVNVKSGIEELAKLTKAFATSPEDVAVEPGLFSARAYASKAKNYMDTIAYLNDQFNTNYLLIQQAIVAGGPNAMAAQNAATAAKTSETNAKSSETNAKSSETKAKTSETNAKLSETNAKTSETASATSASASAASAAYSKDVADNFAGIVDLTVLDDNAYLAMIS